MSSSSSSSGAHLAEATPERFAFTTLVTSDSYVDGALVLLHSLRRTLTPYNIVCLATPLTLSADSLRRLHQHFDGVIETDLRLSDDDQGLSVLGRPDLRSTLTKIQLWDPALFGAWDAVCYLDADTLVRQPIDDVFGRFYTWRENTPAWSDGGLIAASPDTGWPDCFNSGVLLLAPGYACHRDLLRRASLVGSSFDGADQGLLNEHFSDWAASAPYRRLPFLYNATANVYYTYEPAMQRFGHEVRVVHFIGISKPWHWGRTPGGSLISDASTSARWRQLVDLWWHVHDEHVSGWRHWKGPFDRAVAFGKGYQHIAEPPASIVAQVAAEMGGSGQQGHGQAIRQTQGSGLGSADGAPKNELEEVSDWDKDWSWAEDRVHPFDYSYLTSHTDPPKQSDHQPHQLQQQPHQDNDMQKQQYRSQHAGKTRYPVPQQQGPRHSMPRYMEQSVPSCQDAEPHVQQYCAERGCEPADGQQYQHQHQLQTQVTATPSNQGGDSARQGGSSKYNPLHVHGGENGCGDRQQSSGHGGYGQQQPSGQPEWMNSQRPWEDVAREGWMHHDGYQPHQYDQSFVGRHIDQHFDSYTQAPPPHVHMYNQEEGGHAAFTPIPLPQDKPLYEASQIVLQPHGDSRSSEQWSNSQNAAHQRSRSMHNLGRHSGSRHQPGNQQGYEHSGVDQQYQPRPQGAHRHHHSHHQPNPHHDLRNNDETQQDHINENRSPGHHSSRSVSSSSPLYYPQPKSPMVVNPVALWESGEEQARRRAWAQQIQQPIDSLQEPSDPVLIDQAPDAQWAATRPRAEAFAPHIAMDRIDSSQLPPETPWKISHVRQRPVNDDHGSQNLQQPPHMGMQFKEGVASDSSARDAAGQFLQRWNEAVIARKIQPQFGNADAENATHSVPKIERGTDAIRLETTVSCEAEDSKGERTVYRFTLSSTLDIGGSRAATQLPQQQQQQQQQQAAQAAATGLPASHASASHGSSLQNPQTGYRYSATSPSDMRDGSTHEQQPDVTILRQPPNYQEPSMSRRSSFVQLQPSQAIGTRAALAAAHSSSGHIDQFAEADARYWRLQRQLIDLEMNQRQQESSTRPTSGSPGAMGQSNDGWDAPHPEKLDLASPPTPTAHPRAFYGFGSFPKNSGRRPSAFSIADPAALMAPQHVRRLSAETTTRPSYTASSLAGTGSDAASQSADAPSPGHHSRRTSGHLAQRRSRSSPRLPMEDAEHREPTSLLAAGGSNEKRPASTSSSEGSWRPGSGRASPRTPTRSRSFSALHKLATHNSAQAATAPQPVRRDPKKQARPVFLTSSSSSSSDNDEGSAAGDDDTGRIYKPGIGRTPTPYPHALPNKPKTEGSSVGGTSAGAAAAPAAQRPRRVPTPLSIPAASGGFEANSFGSISPASASTPLTPGRQKLRPKISWGDDDDESLPADDDKSIDAQWLRIIKGGPPQRVPARPVDSSGANTPHMPKGHGSAESTAAPLAVVSKEEGAPIEHGKPEAAAEGGTSLTEVAESGTAAETNVSTAAAAATDTDHEGGFEVPNPEATAVVDKHRAKGTADQYLSLAPEKREQEKDGAADAIKQAVSKDAVSAPAEKVPEQPAQSARAPPRRLHSTRSFLNLTSQVFDTISDSDVDASEAELQEQFWSRAMKPPTSDSSTPRTPGRCRSVVELSSTISPRDLEEWMQWQGASGPNRDTGTNETHAFGGESKQGGSTQQVLITPPVSKDDTLDLILSARPAANRSAAKGDGGRSDESEKNGTEIQRSHDGLGVAMKHSESKDSAAVPESEELGDCDSYCSDPEHSSRIGNIAAKSVAAVAPPNAQLAGLVGAGQQTAASAEGAADQAAQW